MGQAVFANTWYCFLYNTLSARCVSLPKRTTHIQGRMDNYKKRIWVLSYWRSSCLVLTCKLVFCFFFYYCLFWDIIHMTKDILPSSFQHISLTVFGHFRRLDFYPVENLHKKNAKKVLLIISFDFCFSSSIPTLLSHVTVNRTENVSSKWRQIQVKCGSPVSGCEIIKHQMWVRFESERTRIGSLVVLGSDRTLYIC